MASEKNATENLNVLSLSPLVTPADVRKMVPSDAHSIKTVVDSRNAISSILQGKDNRKFVIMGPCSIHDPISAMEYSKRLRELAKEVDETLVLVMRAYFEKPRTTLGWKGYINDPMLDNSFQMNEGLIRARKILADITRMGVPVATEALEPITPQYLFDLVSWTAIGARTTESQTHRELASGLSSPVGFKNNTDGNIDVAINAMMSASRPHHFLGIDQSGQTSIISTSGNKYCHLILRGGRERPNYDSVSLSIAREALLKAKLNLRLVVDCSHDNSLKDYRNQPRVFMDCLSQILKGNEELVGFMLESHINEGSQTLAKELKYGISITDGCINFKTSSEMILEAHRELLKRR